MFTQPLKPSRARPRRAAPAIWLFATAAICTAAPAWSQNNLQPIFSTEGSLIAAQAISAYDKQRYIGVQNVSMAKVSNGKMRPLFMEVQFFDCKAPRRVATVKLLANLEQDPANPPSWADVPVEGAVVGEFKPEELPYKTLNEEAAAGAARIQAARPDLQLNKTPRTLDLLATLSCEAKGDVDKEKKVAERLMETGDVADLRTLSCIGKSTADPNAAPVESTIKFSPAKGYVQFNGRWSMKPSVSDDALGATITNGSTIVVDRRTGDFRWRMPDGDLLVSGQCSVGEKVPRKF